MIITICLNNEVSGALYYQTKGQKSAVKWCLCVSLFADIINDCIYNMYSAKREEKVITPVIVLITAMIIHMLIIYLNFL